MILYARSAIAVPVVANVTATSRALEQTMRRSTDISTSFPKRSPEFMSGNECKLHAIKFNDVFSIG